MRFPYLTVGMPVPRAYAALPFCTELADTRGRVSLRWNTVVPLCLITEIELPRADQKISPWFEPDCAPIWNRKNRDDLWNDKNHTSTAFLIPWLHHKFGEIVVTIIRLPYAFVQYYNIKVLTTQEIDGIIHRNTKCCSTLTYIRDWYFFTPFTPFKIIYLNLYKGLIHFWTCRMPATG